MELSGDTDNVYASLVLHGQGGCQALVIVDVWQGHPSQTFERLMHILGVCNGRRYLITLWYVVPFFPCRLGRHFSFVNDQRPVPAILRLIPFGGHKPISAGL